MESSSARADELKAIGLMILGVSIVPGMDAIAKYLSAEYSVFQISWARFVFHVAFVLPLVWWRHRKDLWPRMPRTQLVRGIFQLSATLFFFAALAYMPIADALALMFAYPLIVTALSPWLLGEKVRGIQWTAVVMGLIGVLFILRPGTGAFHWAGVFALAASVCFALYMITTRQVAGTSPPLVSLVYSAAIGAFVLTLGAPSFWTPPRPAHWALMVLIGLIAAIGHFMVIHAFELAPASRVVPFGYVEIVAATVLGYLVFGDFPDQWSLVGIAIICAAGLLVSYRAPGEAV